MKDFFILIWFNEYKNKDDMHYGLTWNYQACADTQISDFTIVESRLNKKPVDSFTIGQINTTEVA